jgi:hypothetical protein
MQYEPIRIRWWYDSKCVLMKEATRRGGLRVPNHRDKPKNCSGGKIPTGNHRCRTLRVAEVTTNASIYF